MESELKKSVLELLSSKFSKKVDEKSSLDLLCEDSMGKVEMLFELEGQLGKKLSEDDVLSVESVGDLLHALENSPNRR